MTDAVDALLEALGSEVVSIGEDVPLRNRQDASNVKPAIPLALVRPRTREQVSEALAICHRFEQCVVTQGGMTGLAGGAHPGTGEIAISLERMSGIEEIDEVAGTLTALAGTPLATIQDQAEVAGFVCGIDLGARGSCTIGGNAATNAGGNHVIRYGMARRNILGLEAVLADGTVVSSLNKFVKNNTGYDWTQLMIGSEGTLGIITRVTLGLHPRPSGIQTAALAFAGFESVPEVLRETQRSFPMQLVTFEVMWREFMDCAHAYCDATIPFDGEPNIIALIELATNDANGKPISDYLADLHDRGLISDAIVAHSGSQAARLWALRETPAEYRSRGFKVHGLDISLPLDRMGRAVETLRARCKERLPELPVFWFGHVGDGNIHVCALFKDDASERHQVVNEIVYDCVSKFGGSISAEHGIGRLKRDYLPISRSADEIALMRRIKLAFDPRGILNRGRIFDGSHG